MFCDRSTQDLLEDKNGPLRPVSTPEGMAENDQVECASCGFARLGGVDHGLGSGGKKPTPESGCRRAGAGEERDRPPQGGIEHQGHAMEPRAAEASALLQSRPANAHSSAEGSAKLVLSADSRNLPDYRGDDRVLAEADR